MSQPTPQTQAPPALQLGAFLGVFTPTILTILGVIMYLRTGWVVGNAGLYGAWGIILFANAITFATALSMSALATNMKVGVGGAYFLISRSLGLEVGGAIGIPLYLSQALSVTLYAYGLSESLVGGFGDTAVMLLAAVIVLGVGAVAARSTELTLKLQLPIMLLIFLSLGSLFLGVSWGGSAVPAFGPWEDGNFWKIFAVFFPAVTGILAGVSLSGDLADPGKAIPRGVLSAVGVGFVVYMLVPYALASGAVALSDPELGVGAEVLRQDNMVWQRLAAVGFLVLPGMWGAILSSAFGSVLAAPRTLQALAQDRLAPSRLGEVDPKTGEPLMALWLTTAIALVAVFLGNLNAVAAVLTMFFLTTYGTLNLVAGVEDLVGDPSFRPRIRIPWWASFLGAAGCFVGMFAIHPGASLVALGIEAAIYFTLRRRSLRAAWGDVRSGFWMSAARYALLALRDAGMDPRNWRPHILVFTSDLSHSIPMVELAADFGQDRGIVTVSTLLVGDVEEGQDADQLLRRNRQLLHDRAVLAFPEVVSVPSFDEGVITVAQANGMASLDSNTVMLGWPGRDAERLAALFSITRKLAGRNKCTLITRIRGTPRQHEHPKLVVWWKGKESNGDLMLLLAYLLSLADGWRGARIVLRSVADDESEATERRSEFAELLPDLRMDVDVGVVVRPEGRDAREIIREHSQDAALVFLGMSLVGPGEERAYAEQMLEMLDGLPSTILVRNAGPFRGRLVG